MNNDFTIVATIANDVASMSPTFGLWVLNDHVVTWIELSASSWPVLIGLDLLTTAGDSLAVLWQVACDIGWDAISDGSTEEQLCWRRSGW